MILFWSIITSMIIISLVFILLPLLNNATHVLFDHTEFNLKIYQNHLSELAAQNASGLLENVHYQTTRNELQRRLLEDMPNQSINATTQSYRSLYTAFLLLLIVPTIALLLYAHWGDSNQIQQLVISQENKMQEENLRSQLGSPMQIILRLQQHLQQNPQSAEGWYLLGRLYASQQQFNQANYAFARAYHLENKKPPL